MVVEITLYYKFSTAFCEYNKIARQKFVRKKEKSPNFLSFDEKCINFGASKPMLRRFELRCFCDKMRPFFSFVQFQETPL